MPQNLAIYKERPGSICLAHRTSTCVGSGLQASVFKPRQSMQSLQKRTGSSTTLGIKRQNWLVRCRCRSGRHDFDTQSFHRGEVGAWFCGTLTANDWRSMLCIEWNRLSVFAWKEMCFCVQEVQVPGPSHTRVMHLGTGLFPCPELEQTGVLHLNYYGSHTSPTIPQPRYMCTCILNT